jgi:hypothetical protein
MPQCLRLQVLDLKASAATEVRRGCSLFLRVAYVVPRFSLGTNFDICLDSVADVNHRAKSESATNGHEQTLG